MGTEVEMKLEMDPRTLERLRKHPVVTAAKVGRGTTRTLTSVYFDTPGRHLHDMGASLRVRHIGARRIQAVKTRGARTGGHLSRGEWETEITTDHPNAETLADLARHAPKVAAVLDRLDPSEGLRPIFVTRFRRTTYVLAGDGWEIELTLDKGNAETGGSPDNGAPPTAPPTAPLCEAELELRHGPPAALYGLARALARDLPLRLAIGSKADAGYALADGRRPVAVKARRLRLDPAQSAADAFQAIGRDCLHHLLVNEPALRLERNSEAVHQMRVALRRFKSALSAFGALVSTPGAAALKSEIAWITDDLGAARDLDVFLTNALPPVESLTPADPGMAILRATLEDRRKAAYDRAVAAVDSPRFTHLVLDIGHWLEDGDWRQPAENEDIARALLARPVTALAAEILAARHAKVRHRGRHFARMDAAQRHALRIHVKKLRYAAEFFSGLFSKRRAKAFSAAMADAQDHLGLLNDIAVGQALLRDLVAGSGDDAMAFAAGTVSGWHAARQVADMEAGARDWKAFMKVRPFWA